MRKWSNILCWLQSFVGRLITEYGWFLDLVARLATSANAESLLRASVMNPWMARGANTGHG